MIGVHLARAVSWRRRVLSGLLLLAWATAAVAAQVGRTVTDMRGRAVTVPAEVSRAIGTGGAVDEWLLLLGRPDKMVATSARIRENPWVAKVYPPILRLPTPLSWNDFNLEGVLAERPQVAILLSGMSCIDKLEQAGVPTVVLERRNAEELMRAISLAAEVLGPAERDVAARYCAYYRGNIRRVTARTESLPPDRRTRVYYAGGSACSTEGKDTMVSSWIELAGGRNVAASAGLAGMGRKVAMEDIVAWDPEVIITMQPAVRDEILASDQWKAVTAVRTHRVYVNPKGVFSWCIRGANEAIQVLWAATVIHPELFGDIDMIGETKNFYTRFYRYALSDAEAGQILDAEAPQ